MDSKEEIIVWWRKLSDWASLVENWVSANGLKGSIFTMYELIEGESSIGKGESDIRLKFVEL